MDGLSAGASVIAVISLAAQLGAGAHTLIKFLNTVSDAPAEIQRLESLLDQIYAIATCVRNALEYQRKLHGEEHILADDVHISLLNCRKKVQGIEHILSIDSKKPRKVAQWSVGNGRRQVGFEGGCAWP
ncbi:uncharacterized protein N7473_007856 [Penicillium subrubescens]|jgi:hypothetical protein|uniref:Fungal N-terminal domain-containing protein n=1 Tax=Penicillium subrubescens TaxID=1316194 RepID=A0A1Q5TJN9_9EURO|nr:uncharacterized protein N7473_007856 [Penicillium subrubescens]KAJ5891628.1 hypothetical protein N7473_007856 [Penicillium subrubescens]OKP00433.1 hypothetical protein PENSUB_7890 [Penicillium subrubescens]